MARLTFSNVPTASGGVISGDISIGAGSPFGAGGQYEAQVADIKATIAKAPAGTYDPKYWDSFLQMDPEKIPEGYRFIPSDDPAITAELLTIPSVRVALQFLSQPRGEYWSKQPQSYQVRDEKIRQSYRDEVAVHVNRLMMKKNAPLIKAIEEQQRQLEIDQAVKLALEQKIRETAKPKETIIVSPPETVEKVVQYSPLLIAGIGIIVFIIILRRRA
jgi:hypothetical protein